MGDIIVRSRGLDSACVYKRGVQSNSLVVCPD